jgi:hypothetical protein
VLMGLVTLSARIVTTEQREVSPAGT